LNGKARRRGLVEDFKNGFELFKQPPPQIVGNFRVRSGCHELNDKVWVCGIGHFKASVLRYVFLAAASFNRLPAIRTVTSVTQAEDLSACAVRPR
jgi:hypothetical protein